MGNKIEEFREKSIKEQERCANMSDERLIRQFTSMSASSSIKQTATLEEIKHRVYMIEKDTKNLVLTYYITYYTKIILFCHSYRHCNYGNFFI